MQTKMFENNVFELLLLGLKYRSINDTTYTNDWQVLNY